MCSTFFFDPYVHLNACRSVRVSLYREWLFIKLAHPLDTNVQTGISFKPDGKNKRCDIESYTWKSVGTNNIYDCIMLNHGCSVWIYENVMNNQTIYSQKNGEHKDKNIISGFASKKSESSFDKLFVNFIQFIVGIPFLDNKILTKRNQVFRFFFRK